MERPFRIFLRTGIALLAIAVTLTACNKRDTPGSADVSPAEIVTKSGVEMAYLLALGRSPTKEQYEKALSYLQASGSGPQKAWASLCQALFASVEFRYVN